MIRIVPVTTIDPAPDPADLAHAWHDVFIAAARNTFGEDHDAWSFESRAARERASDWDRRYIAALEGERVVAAGEVSVPLLDNPKLALADVVVHPEHRRRGIGAQLLDHVSALAHEAGRSVLVVETAHPSEGVDAGGSVQPTDGFLLSRGFTVGQTMLRNDVHVSHHAHRKPVNPKGYVIETSTDDTPRRMTPGMRGWRTAPTSSAG